MWRCEDVKLGLDEEEADAGYAYHGSDDFADSYPLVEEECGWSYDEYWGKSEKGLGDAGGGVLGGEE